MYYEVIDNYLNNDDLNKLENFVWSMDMPWYYSEKYIENGDPNKFFFVHLLLNAKTKETSFIMNDYAKPIFDKLNPKNLRRAQVNCYPKRETHTVSESHTDFFNVDFKFKSAIFYINTNNGATILHHKDGDIRVNSVKNRILIFDGHTRHRVITQTDTNLRLNINMVYSDE